MQLLNSLPSTRSFRPVVRARLIIAALAGLGLAGAAWLPAARAQQPATSPSASAPAASAATGQTGVGQAEAEDANIAIAQRMAQAASEIVQGDQTGRNALAWHQAVAFLEAARRLDPNDARYPRLQADAYTHLGDTDAWASSTEAYLQKRGDDDQARLKLIEYYVAKMQTVDAKLAYLLSLLEKQSISNELKSRCATFAAVLLGERSVRRQVEMTDKALELDPLNIYARRLEHAQLLAAGAGPEERLQSLFAQLRCNPAQVRILETIGREMAAAGIARDALDWMASAKNLSLYIAQPDPNFFVDYSAQLYINGMTKEAEEGVSLVLQADPRNIDAWFLLLTLRKAAGLQVALDQDLDRARAIFASRAGAIADLIEAQNNAATRPAGAAGQPDVDFSSAFAPSAGPTAGPGNEGPAPAAPSGQRLNDIVNRLKAPEAPPQQKAAFVAALTDLAWFEVYYNQSAASARTWIDALGQLLPPEDITIVRLRGWFELMENRQAEAMKILWAIRDRDALAAMGVSRLLGQGNWKSAAANAATRPASQDPTRTAQALLNKHPSGLLGAILVAEFKDRKLKAEPGPSGEAMKKIASAFPVDLLQVLVQADRFYAPVGAPLKVPYRLGEPLLVDLALLNRTEYDLPIGPDGIIKPDLWFDARVSLGVEKVFPMSGYDKVAGPLVLKGRTRTSQVVRVDQGEMTPVLRERPSGNVNIYMTVMTNPMVRQDYRVVPGPGGVRQQFTRSLIRGGMPIYSEPQKKTLLKGLKGLPNEKLWTIDVLTAMVEQARGSDAEQNVKAAASDFHEQIRMMQTDRVPLVGAYATFAMVLLTEPDKVEERTKLVESLLASPAWESRMTGIWAARWLPAAEQKRVLASVASDENPLVKQAAEAGVKLADVAATRPATQPTSTPSTTLPADPADGPALPPGVDGPKLPLPGQ